MRDVFPGYYKPTKDEMAELWTNALVVLDTNALLNLFRYTNATREAFLKVLSAKRDRLWLPHQVGLEFHRNRLGVIDAQASAFNDLITKAKTALASVTSDVGKLRNHPTLDLDDLRSTVSAAVASIETKVEATRDKYQTDVLDAARHDETTDVITDLYENRVGAPYDEAKISEICKIGADRYDREVPPGYKDSKKPEPDRYGDLILWFQILEKAEADSAAVIFVGDDQKEDWWREFKGKKIGPRVELIDEFRSRSGKRIYFLTPYALMELAKEHDDDSITSDAVKEVAQVSEAQARLNEFIHATSPDEGFGLIDDLGSLSMREIEVLRRRLHKAREIEEIHLREVLNRSNEIAAAGGDESGEYADAVRQLNRHRRIVAGYSNSINEAEWELERRRRPHHAVDVNAKDQIDLARLFLSHSEAEPLLGEGSWEKASDADIAGILSLVRAGVAPPSISKALKSLVEFSGSKRAEAEWDDSRSDERLQDRLRRRRE